MQKQSASILSLAATYIGTVVGAGFASGQEVLQFFGLLGSTGIPAIVVAIIGFFLFGFSIMEIGRNSSAASHYPVIEKAVGKTLVPFLDLVITFFLFGALSAMIAGAGSVLNQEFGLHWISGAITMAVFALVTVLFGLKGVVYAISSVVPFLIASVLIVSIAVIYVKGFTIGLPPEGYEPPIRLWPLAGINYVSYNILMAVPVLAVLGATCSSRKTVGISALLGALGLGIGLFFVYLSIVSSFPDVIQYEVPMARLASQVFRLGKPLYTTVFLAEVYTTAVANLYGFSVRIAQQGSKGFKLTAVISAALALCAASTGFSTLVRIIYPLVGWAGTVLLFALFIYLIKAFVLNRSD